MKYTLWRLQVFLTQKGKEEGSSLWSWTKNTPTGKAFLRVACDMYVPLEWHDSSREKISGRKTFFDKSTIKSPFYAQSDWGLNEIQRKDRNIENNLVFEKTSLTYIRSLPYTLG